MVGESIKGNSEETFSCQMKIPNDAVNTVQNCDIIFVDHYIKVLLVIWALRTTILLAVGVTKDIRSHYSRILHVKFGSEWQFSCRLLWPECSQLFQASLWKKHQHCRNTILEGSNPAVLSVLPGGKRKQTNQKKKRLSSRSGWIVALKVWVSTPEYVCRYAFVTNHYVLVKPTPNSKQPHFCDIVHHVALALLLICVYCLYCWTSYLLKVDIKLLTQEVFFKKKIKAVYSVHICLPLYFFLLYRCM